MMFRKKSYGSLEKLRQDVDRWLYATIMSAPDRAGCAVYEARCRRSRMAAYLEGKVRSLNLNSRLHQTGDCQIKSELLHLRGSATRPAILAIPHVPDARCSLAVCVARVRVSD